MILDRRNSLSNNQHLCLKWLSEAKQKARSEASRQNISKFYFDAKLRFALLASLRSAIFSEIQIDN